MTRPPPPAAGASGFLTPRVGLLLILGGAALLRVALALQGGQYYFGDEQRFLRGAAAWMHLRDGEIIAAARLLGAPAHTGFGYVATAICAVQQGLAGLAGEIGWREPGFAFRIAPFSAAWLGLFSTLNVWLVWRLARRLGAAEPEALFAALLAAGSVSLAQYSRHLLPYDCALAAALGSLLLALSAPSAVRLGLSGLLTGLCFEFYNGYWFLVPTVALAVWLGRAGLKPRLQALLPWGAGCATGLLLCMLPGLLLSPQDYWSGSVTFSRTVLQGVFAEGWSLPWAYFWHAEGLVGVLLALLLVATAVRLRWRGLPERVRLALTLAATAYALLVVLSVVLEKFVVYARSCRPLVPFLCLAGGFALARLAGDSRPRRLGLAALLTLGLLLNAVPHLTLTFPQEIVHEVARTIGAPKSALTYSGTFYRAPFLSVTRPDLALVDALHPIPLRAHLPPPAGRVLFSVEHPAAFPPYQYDGYTPRERRLLREHGLRIQLIELADPASVPDNPPADQLFRAEERHNGRDLGPRS